MVDNVDADYRIPIDIRDLTLIFRMLKESNPYTGQLNYIYVCEILHRIAEANKQPGAESFLDFTELSEIEDEFRKAMAYIQKGEIPSQQPSQQTTDGGTTIKMPPESKASITERGEEKGLSKEKTKKSNPKGKSAESIVKKKKESKEDLKVNKFMV